MKQGKTKTLSELARALEDQQARKLDFIADTRDITIDVPPVEVMENGEAAPPLKPIAYVENIGQFNINNHAARQMCSRLKVPAKFFDLMEGGTNREREALSEVLNARLHENPESRMLRTFTMTPDAGLPGGDDGRPTGLHYGNARAFLSDRYRRMDNIELLMNALPVLQEAGELEVVSCETTERRMFLKVTFPGIEAEPVVGDVVRSGVVISNSEVGHGSLKVERMIYRLVCLNGMTVGESMRKFHVGRVQDVGLLNVLSDEAVAADDNALWLAVRDVIRATLDEDAFAEHVRELSESATRTVVNPPKAIEVLAQTFKLGEKEQQGVLSALIKSDPMLDRNGVRNTQYGLIQAVTAFSQELRDYERATELEAMGGQILALPRKQWARIAEAA